MTAFEALCAAIEALQAVRAEIDVSDEPIVEEMQLSLDEMAAYYRPSRRERIVTVGDIL